MKTLFHHIRTFVLVSVIAGLVWIYAENENIKTYPKETVRVRFVPPEGQNLSIEPKEMRVLLTLRGNNAQIQAFRGLVKQGPIELPVQPGSDPGDPQQSISLAQRWAESPLADLNMNLIEIDPPTQILDVRRLEEVRIPVEVIRGDLPTPPDTPPVANPTEVRVILPEELVAAARTLRAQVRLDEASVDRDRMGVEQRTVANVELPASLRSRWTELKDTTARVSFTLEDRSEQATQIHEIASRGVRVAYAPESGERYRLELAEGDRIVRNIRLSGSPEAIAYLKNHESEVMAIAPLLGSDIAAANATGGRIPVQVTITTPPGVRVISPTPSVTIIVKRLEAVPDPNLVP